jgi:hypothetical protein
MSDGLTTGCEATVADSGGKDLEEVDWVGNVTKRWILEEGVTETGPNVPADHCTEKLQCGDRRGMHVWS